MKRDLMLVYDETMNAISHRMVRLPWDCVQFYAHWLAQSYHFVCHSTRLLAASMARIPVSQARLHRRMAEHIREEGGHETLATRDLQRLGFDISGFEEINSTKVFYGYQYFGIDRVSPYMLFGYIMYLEGLAIKAGPAIFEQINNLYPAKATTFVRVHTEEDVSHVEQAIKEIQALPEVERELVIDNFEASHALYNLILDEVVSSSKRAHRNLGPFVDAII